MRRSRADLQARHGVTTLEFRAALHVGEIFFGKKIYGNTGSQSRLDFSAIGPAVKFPSCLLDKAGGLNAKTVFSEQFKSIITMVSDSGTLYELKGTKEPV